MSRRAAREAQAATGRKSAPKAKAAKPAKVKAQSKPANPTQPGFGAGDGTPGKAGIGSIFTQHPKIWIGVALGVSFLILGTGSLIAGSIIAGDDDVAGPITNSADTAGRSVLAELPLASRLRTCSIAELATDPRLMTFSGAVRSATTGELLFDRNANSGVAQGAQLKILTAAAALNILGPTTTLTTRVYEGSSPGKIVLVGSGDPTLSAVHSGESVYAGAPKLDDLAEQIVVAYDDEPITSIVLDATLWDVKDSWDETWKKSERTHGRMSPVTALQIDGARDDPRSASSPRSADPVASAGTLFAQALEDAGANIDTENVTFSSGSAITTKPLLGQVNSQPISVLINQMLVMNDNTLAESLGRIMSKSMSLGGTSASLSQAIPNALGLYGVDATGITVRDASGLSTSNSVSPAFMSEFMIEVLGGAQELNYVFNSLDVAGKTGFLASRFSGDNTVARGNVFGLSGWIETEYSLAGTINAADGTQLTFAFYADGSGVKSNAKDALDALTTAAFSCGDNLSNN